MNKLYRTLDGRIVTRRGAYCYFQGESHRFHWADVKEGIKQGWLIPDKESVIKQLLNKIDENDNLYNSSSSVTNTDC